MRVISVRIHEILLKHAGIIVNNKVNANNTFYATYMTHFQVSKVTFWCKISIFAKHFKAPVSFLIYHGGYIDTYDTTM